MRLLANIMGDKLPSQSWVFYLFIGSRTSRTEKLVFLNFLTKHFLALMCSFVCLGFVNRLLMPRHLHKTLYFEAILTQKNTECCHGSFVISQINILCHPQYYNNYKKNDNDFQQVKKSNAGSPSNWRF